MLDTNTIKSQSIKYSRKTSLINAYLDERMSAKAKKDFEEVLSECSTTRDLFEKKKAHLEFIQDLIPNPKLTAKGHAKLESEFADINEGLLQKVPATLSGKIYSFITKPFIEF